MSAARPRKRLGQHFLHERNVIARILRAIDPQPGQHFIEIGPGTGALTGPLLDAGVDLTAIELDRELAAELSARWHRPTLRVLQGDALRVDFEALPGAPWRLAGNLPYNISTPLLFHLLDHAQCFDDLHLMLQKEVVERMAAGPGSKVYGRLSVALAVRCRVEPLFGISPGAFRPPPKVESAFVRLLPDSSLAARIADRRLFDELLRQAFSMRRKQLANSLRALLPPGDIRALDIDPASRPENLAPEQFVALANACAARTGRPRG